MRWPSCRISTRSPSRPRTTGRAGARAEAADGDARLILAASRPATSRAAWSAPAPPARSSAGTRRTGCAPRATDSTSSKCSSGSTGTSGAGRRRGRTVTSVRVRVALRLDDQVVGAGRQAIEGERAVGRGRRLPALPFDDHDGARHRIARQRIHEPARHGRCPLGAPPAATPASSASDRNKRNVFMDFPQPARQRQHASRRRLPKGRGACTRTARIRGRLAESGAGVRRPGTTAGTTSPGRRTGSSGRRPPAPGGPRPPRPNRACQVTQHAVQSLALRRGGAVGERVRGGVVHDQRRAVVVVAAARRELAAGARPTAARTPRRRAAGASRGTTEHDSSVA